MKKIIYTVSFLLLMITGGTALGQAYTTAADTVKLNKEFTEVSNDIAALTAKLTIAKNNRPSYQSKASDAATNAHDAAMNSRTQASNATNSGGVKEARKAKRSAKKAYREAKDARSAKNNISDQDDRIASLTGELAKKHARLEQLITMRASINALLTKQ